MPIYEYRCEPCNHRFEAFLATSSEQAVCPQCNGSQLHKLMSTFAASVPGGYKSAQMGSSGGASSASSAAPAADSGTSSGGGCGGGCACH